jgi:hypothetical protein
VSEPNAQSISPPGTAPAGRRIRLEKIAGAAFIAAGATVSALGAAAVASRDAVHGAAFIAAGTAGIALGAAIIGPRASAIRAGQRGTRRAAADEWPREQRAPAEVLRPVPYGPLAAARTPEPTRPLAHPDPGYPQATVRGPGAPHRARGAPAR